MAVTVTIRWRSVMWFVTGMVAAVMAAWFLHASRVAAAPTPGESTFVPISPCRLLDTRPETLVGPRAGALGAAETYTVQVTGTNGRCTIPAGISGVAINTTIVSPSAPGFLSLYPAGIDWPGTSNLNWVAGQAPTPNKVDVAVSADGRLNVYNSSGTVHVIGDIVGYYTTTGITDLTTQVNALQTQLTALQTLTASMSLQTVDGQPTVRFSGVNVQVVSGSGTTNGTVNGRGNLIVGYNDNAGDNRTGSHNLVVGDFHSYDSYGGLIAGVNNTITSAATYATVSGGTTNTASGESASVTGGAFNTASDEFASVTGGAANTASGVYASVTGGEYNTASGEFASVTGGDVNTASGQYASVTGGYRNTASGNEASVTGGSDNAASSNFASVTGGRTNRASGVYASVTGGYFSTASGRYASVTGGQSNRAVGDQATVTGGFNNEAGGEWAAVTGGASNTANGASSSITGGANLSTTTDYERK